MRVGKYIAGFALLLSLLLPASAAALPANFFGIVPQAPISEADAQYMSAGGIESVRAPIIWPTVQPGPAPVFSWAGFDETVTVASRAGLHVLPLLIGTPAWLGARETTLPVGSAAERAAWTVFVAAAVQRYGPHGTFWLEHGPLSAQPLPEEPIRTWQIWNEPNFHYFASPVSPRRYAALLRLTTPVIKALDPGAKVLLGGLFGKPRGRRSNGIPAATFLAGLYRVRGIGRYFDGVALHPYAYSQKMLHELVEAVHGVIALHRPRVPLYITELGWGSQRDPRQVAFERGIGGQARELRRAYRFLIGNRHRFGVAGVYWFAWKDLAGSCNYCDSVGLFDGGPGFVPKPAWNALVALTGGRPSP